MCILDPVALASSVDAAFLRPAPPIEVVVELGHPDLGGEQAFQCYAAKFLDCADPAVFYARAVGLSWADSYVVDGRAFPGLDAVAPADLKCAAYLEIRQDILLCSDPTPPAAATVALEDLSESLASAFDLRGVLPAIRVQEVVSDWNWKRFLWATGTCWVMAEWSTTA